MYKGLLTKSSSHPSVCFAMGGIPPSNLLKTNIMATEVVANRRTPAGVQPVVVAAAQGTAAEEQTQLVVEANYTVQEFKDLMGIGSFEVLKHKTNGKMFMGSKGKSIGAVSRSVNLAKEVQVIEIIGDGGEPLFILCNRGEGSNYEGVKVY